MPRNQNTIAKAIDFEGTALFSGEEVNVRLCPAEPGAGYLFVRTDMPDNPVVPASAENVGDGYRSTVLRAPGERGREAAKIRSPEHLLSACTGLQIDNLVVEVSGEEMPACGGCAMPWVEALQEAGIEEQNEQKQTFHIDSPVAISEDGASITGTPIDDDENDEDGLTVTYILEFERTPLPAQVHTCTITPKTYVDELARCRTFSEEDAYEKFRKRGIGQGVTDDNALVVFEDGTVRAPLSQEEKTPHFPNEFARHKIIDLLGDLALAGYDITGKIVAVRSGHHLNSRFVSRLRHLVEEEEKGPEEYLDIRDIHDILPHRYPFLMVDRIISIEEESKITGLKNVSMNEEYFQGHYPGNPIMPGVLQLEALAQVAGVLLLQKLEHTGKVAFLVSMDGVKLRRPVEPGDQLLLEADAVRVRSRSAQIKAKGSVGDEVACEAEMRFMLVDREVI